MSQSIASKIRTAYKNAALEVVGIAGSLVSGGVGLAALKLSLAAGDTTVAFFSGGVFLSGLLQIAEMFRVTPELRAAFKDEPEARTTNPYPIALARSAKNNRASFMSKVADGTKSISGGMKIDFLAGAYFVCCAASDVALGFPCYIATEHAAIGLFALNNGFLRVALNYRKKNRLTL